MEPQENYEDQKDKAQNQEQNEPTSNSINSQDNKKTNKRRRRFYLAAVLVAVIMVVGGLLLYMQSMRNQPTNDVGERSNEAEEHAGDAFASNSDYRMLYKLSSGGIDNEDFYFISDIDGSNPVQLSTYESSPGIISYDVSPDGKYILRSTENSIDIAQASEPENFTKLIDTESKPITTWMEGGSFLYEVRVTLSGQEDSHYPEGEISLYESDIDGSASRLIYKETTRSGTIIILHADKEASVFYHATAGGGASYIEGLRKSSLADGSLEAKDLVDREDMTGASFADYMSRATIVRRNPDGTSDVVIKDITTGEETTVYTADTSGEDQYGNSSNIITLISPNGGAIAIHETKKPDNAKPITIYDIASGEFERLTDSAKYDNLAIKSWVPDGSYALLGLYCHNCPNRDGDVTSNENTAHYYIADIESREVVKFNLPNSISQNGEIVITNDAAQRKYEVSPVGWLVTVE